MTSALRRAAAGVAAVVMLGAIASVFAAPASAQTGVGRVSAFATGTVLHADLLQSGASRLVDAEVAFSGATYDTGGIRAALLNEMDRRFAPQLPSKLGFGRGTALEVGLGVAPNTENQLILAGKAERAAPPNLGLARQQVGPLDLDPLAYADVLRGEALANANQNDCVLGKDAARGLGYIADAELLDAASSESGVGLEQPTVALDADTPARAVSQSLSRNVFVRQRARDGRLLGPRFGMMSEVRQTIAPLTLFRGTSNEVTIEFLGEWVLRAVATGIPGGAWIQYGPGSVSPETPVLRLIDNDGTQTLLKLQQILGDDGLVVDLGVAELAIGEPPRAINGAAGSGPAVASNGTSASAAVDVVRVRALPGAPAQLTDLRVGHMEVKAAVPSGGVNCPIPVRKSPSASSMQVGQSVRMNFTVTNPYDCTLKAVRLGDAITTEGDARFDILSTSPSASSVTEGSALQTGTIIWNNIGDIRPGASRTVSAVIGGRGGVGAIVDKATASATLADCAEPGTGVGGAAIRGTSAPVRVPLIAVGVGARFSELPRSGASTLWSIVVGLALIALAGGGRVLLNRSAS